MGQTPGVHDAGGTEGRVGHRRAVVVALAVLVLLLGACSSDGDGEADAAPRSTTSVLPPVEVDPATTGGRTPLPGFGQVLVEARAADGRTCELCLLLAEDSAQRARGLMEVTDPSLGGYDGMLFSYGDSPGSGGFWMRNTRIPLTGVFYDAEGEFLGSFAMVPCPDATSDAACPRYGPDEPFTTVIELADLAPEDVLLTEGSTIEVVGDECPVELAGRP